MKNTIQKIIGKFGYQILKKTSTPTPTINKHSSYLSQLADKQHLPLATMEEALQVAKNWDLGINTIIDIGAAKGTWTQTALTIWKDANYLLLEPLEESIEELEKLKKNNPKLDYKLVVAGEEEGEVSFSVSSDLDGSGVYEDENPNARTVPVLPLDKCVKTAGNYLLKLDTHGYEVPIFEGATEILKKTTLIVVEVYGFYVSPTALLFPDLCKYLEEKGFRFVNIADIMYRGKDKAFWQADFLFLRSDHSVFKDNMYQ